MNTFLSLLRKITRYPKQLSELRLLRESALFDGNWYLANNPDVAKTEMDPLLHYYRYGGFEGRDPSLGFSSRWYLDTYEDVKKAGINPLVHYLRYGREEGRKAMTQQIGLVPSSYQCPVCENEVNEFLPLSPYFEENKKKHGNPFTFDDLETLNNKQYSCPHCGASDRDRLFACYLNEKISWFHKADKIHLLDIAPSKPLNHFIDKIGNIIHHTADLYLEDVDFVVDITNMPKIASKSYDMLICSHVLEHVNDDKRAFAELYRVLKPRGWGIIMVPINLKIRQIDEDPEVIDISERWRRFGQDDHVRLYSKSSFVERLETAGFIVKQLGVDYFGEPAFNKYGITNKSVLYIAEK
jgi:hypothetical protein